MKIFYLPDLGEGLPDAELRQWYIKEGDYVEVDQPIASLETAKALVDIPSPQSGYIVKCYVKPNDIINTGDPFVEFKGDTNEVPIPSPPTREEINRHTSDCKDVSEQILHSTRRAMAMMMQRAHTETVPAILYEDADIHAWNTNEDYTLRLIRAVTKACQIEPALNAHYFATTLSRKLFSDTHIGIALDTPAGLYMPVLKNTASTTTKALREQIDRFKQEAETQTFAPDSLKGASIMLSNFGSIGGRYAMPVIIPPIVAIIAAGRAREQVVAVENQAAVHKIMPLTLAFDHRAVTGGEAARFLIAMIKDLEQPL